MRPKPRTAQPDANPVGGTIELPAGSCGFGLVVVTGLVLFMNGGATRTPAYCPCRTHGGAIGGFRPGHAAFSARCPSPCETFVLAMIPAVLDRRTAVLTVVAYVLLGAVGLPVFSGFMGGFGALAGPTGGFLWGFILGMVAAGVLDRALPARIPAYPRALASAAVLLLVSYGMRHRPAHGVSVDRPGACLPSRWLPSSSPMPSSSSAARGSGCPLPASCHKNARHGT